jgi:hypothetical protein
MSLDDLSPEEIEVKQQELLAAVPEANPIGNKTLREQLGTSWPEDLYWAIRNRLIERGQLETGKGKGGSVKRVPSLISQETQPGQIALASGVFAQVEEPYYTREQDLYSPIAAVLRNQWSKEQGFDNYLVEITAKQGSRPTGGKWTRPDITAVGYKTFPYVPGRYLEVVTFEVKPTNTTDVAAVYEALAHRRAATRAYVIAHMPNDKKNEFQAVIDAICDESKKFGVGVILADDPANFDTWEVLLESERVEPDPGRLNEFIAQQATPELKEQIVRWFK